MPKKPGKPSKPSKSAAERPPEPAHDQSAPPAIPPPGRVHRSPGGHRPTGMAGLRAKLNLTDQTTLTEVADSALAMIADLETELSKPPRGDRLEIQSRSKYSPF